MKNRNYYNLDCIAKLVIITSILKAYIRLGKNKVTLIFFIYFAFIRSNKSKDQFFNILRDGNL